MMRNYNAMRDLLMMASNQEEVTFDNTISLVEQTFTSRKDVVNEIKRLEREGLIVGDMQFDASDALVSGSIKGLTNEGVEFLRFIENPEVWKICTKTLDDAKIDLSYPFLKEVCEEIVKRYVFGKIPSNI